MSGPFDKELESIASTHTHEFARKLAHEVANLILRKLGIEHAALAAFAQSGSSKKKGVKAVLPAKLASGKKAAAAPAALPAASASAASPGSTAVAAAARKRPNGEDRASALEKVFKIVQARDGVAVGEVVKATSLERGSVAAALKALKEEGRIHMGGSRRFARYALSQAAADRASETARKGQ